MKNNNQVDINFHSFEEFNGAVIEANDKSNQKKIRISNFSKRMKNSYDIRHADNSSEPVTIEPTVTVNHLSQLFTDDHIDFDDKMDKYIEINDDMREVLKHPVASFSIKAEYDEGSGITADEAAGVLIDYVYDTVLNPAQYRTFGDCTPEQKKEIVSEMNVIRHESDIDNDEYLSWANDFLNGYEYKFSGDEFVGMEPIVVCDCVDDEEEDIPEEPDEDGEIDFNEFDD